MMTGSSGLAMERTLADDLPKDRRRDVLAGLGVADSEVVVILYHQGEVVEGHVDARVGAVEPLVSVLLDEDRLRNGRHESRVAGRGAGFGGGITFKIGAFRRPGYPLLQHVRGRRSAMPPLTWIKGMVMPIWFWWHRR